VLARYLPEQPAIHPGDELTDRNERFLAAELIAKSCFASSVRSFPTAPAWK